MSAAVVAKVTGKAVILRGSESLPLSRNAELHSSDAVRTEAGAKVELRFSDGATIELGPSTQVELKDFAFDPQGESQPSFVMHMLEGAVRSVSGKVVEQNPEAFKLTSPMGAVGIRGTTTLHLIYANYEVHVIQEISGKHVVVVTTPDGRSITLTGSATGVTITSGDLSPLALQNISPGEMLELLKIWLYENNTADSMQHFLTGETAGLIYKLAALFISGQLGVDGLDANFLVSVLNGGSGGLDPLYISGTETLDGLDQPSLGDPPGESAAPLPLMVGIYGGSDDDWLIGTPGDDVMYGYGGNDFIWTGAGNDTAYGGYGSSDTIVKPGVMAIGSYLYGDEEILPENAQADNDVIIIGNAPSSVIFNGVPTHTAPYDAGYGPGDMTGGIIYGNARIMEDGSFVDTVVGGNSITVQGEMSGGTIYGDAEIVGNGVTCGNDNITVGSLSGGTIYGDAASYTGAHTAGANNITVVNDMSGGTIYGGAGNDVITVGSMSGGLIDGGGGADSITVSGAFTGGTIRIGGADTLTLQDGATLKLVVEDANGNDVSSPIVIGADPGTVLLASGAVTLTDNGDGTISYSYSGGAAGHVLKVSVPCNNTAVTITAVDTIEGAEYVQFNIFLSNPPQEGHPATVIVAVAGERYEVPIGPDGTGTLLVDNPNTEDGYLDASTLTATIVDVIGGNYEEVTGIGETATAYIADTINATDAAISLSTNEAGELVVTVTLSSQDGLDVSPGEGESATVTFVVNGREYSVVISGHETSGTLEIPGVLTSKQADQILVEAVVINFTHSSKEYEEQAFGSDSNSFDPVLDAGVVMGEAAGLAADEKFLDQGAEGAPYDGTAADGGATWTASQELTFTVADGFGSIIIGSQELTGPVTNYDITGKYGTLRVTLNLSEDGTSGTVTYQYLLTGPAQHADAGGTNVDIADLRGDELFAVIVKDVDGDTASTSIAVTIVDDVPSLTIESDGGSISRNCDATGTVTLVEGADGADWSTFTLNGNPVGAFDSAGKAVVATEYGAVTLTQNADGTISYSYTIPGDAADGDAYELTFFIKDNDGDPTSDSVSFSVSNALVFITDPDDPGKDLSIEGQLLSVDERGLAAGSDPGSNAHISAEQVMNFNVADGFASITIGGEELTAAGTYAIEGEYGALHVTLTLDSDGKSGTAAYHYELTDRAQHADADGRNVDIADFRGDELFAVIVKDVDGDTASTSIAVTIVDDVPAVIESGAALPPLPISDILSAADVRNQFTTAYGADGQGADDAYSLNLNGTAVSTGLHVVDGGGGMGEEILLYQNADGPIEGRDSSDNVYFTLSIQATGTEAGQVTLTQSDTYKIWHDVPGSALKLALDPGVLTLMKMVTDGDGDTASAHIDIGAAVVFQFDDTSSSTTLIDLLGNAEAGNAGTAYLTLNGPYALTFTDPSVSNTLAVVTASAGGIPSSVNSGARGIGVLNQGLNSDEQLNFTFTNVQNYITFTEGSGGVIEGTWTAYAEDGTTVVASDTFGPVSLGSGEIIIDTRNEGPFKFLELYFGPGCTPGAATTIGSISVITFGDAAFGIEGASAPLMLPLNFEGGNIFDPISGTNGTLALTTATVDESCSATGGTIGSAPLSPVAIQGQSASNYGAHEAYSLRLNGASVHSGLHAVAEGGGKGAEILLSQSGGEITGSADGTEYFRIIITQDTGEVSLELLHSIWHPDSSDHHDVVTLDPGAGVLTLMKTVTDGNGITASTSFDLGAAGLLRFEDDGPQVEDCSDPGDPLTFNDSTGHYANESGYVTFDYGSDGFQQVSIMDDGGNSLIFAYTGAELPQTQFINYDDGAILAVTVDEAGNLRYTYDPAETTVSHCRAYTVTAMDGDGDTATHFFIVAVDDGITPLVSPLDFALDNPFVALDISGIDGAQADQTTTIHGFDGIHDTLAPRALDGDGRICASQAVADHGELSGTTADSASVSCIIHGINVNDGTVLV